MEDFLKMKKIIAECLTVLLTATAAFALDTTASVYMTGTLANGEGNGSVDGLNISNQAQQYPHMLTFTVSDKNYGAQFWLWTKLAGDATYLTNIKGDTSTLDNAVYASNAMLWFKPIDMLKISVGNVGQYLYTEQLHWWKDGLGGKATDAAVAYYLRYSNYTGIEGGGINFTLTPVEGLTIDLGSGEGFGNTLWTVNNWNLKYNDWGATVKYQVNDKVSLGIGWRDMGSDGSSKPSDYSMAAKDDYYKVLTTGFDVKTDNMYGFLQPRMLFNEYYGFEGVTFDNYFRYTSGAITFQSRVPFTYRQQDSGEDDPSYLIYDLKTSYKVNDSISPFIELSNDDGGNYTPLCFGTEAKGDSLADTFVIHVYPGADFVVGKCNITAGVSLNTYTKNSSPAWGWTIPFSARVNF